APAGYRAADLRPHPHDRATRGHHARILARLARLIEDVRVEVAVAGVEDVPDAQAVSGDDLVDAAEHVRELRARDHTVHHHVRGRHATVGAERGLAPLPQERALGLVPCGADLAGARVAARRDDPLGLRLHADGE